MDTSSTYTEWNVVTIKIITHFQSIIFCSNRLKDKRDKFEKRKNKTPNGVVEYHTNKQ